MTGCLNCLSESVCIECSMNYLDLSTNKCVENCYAPTPLNDDSTHTCKACNKVLPYCSECESDGSVCTKCEDDYPYLLSSLKGCTANCATDFGYFFIICYNY